MIQRGVHITMANKTTIWAFEGSLTERHILNVEPTVAAPMAASSCPGTFNYASTACYSFVFQEANEGSPACIADILCEAMVLEHIVNVQVLDSDEGIFRCELPAELVLEVSPLIGNFEMLLSQSETSLSSIGRSFYFPAKSSLQELEFLFRIDEEARIGDELSVGKGGEALDADIYSDLLLGRMDDLAVRQFAAEAGEPLVSFVPLNSQSLDLSFGNTMKDDWDVAYLAQSKSFVGKQFETRLRISDAFHPALESGKTFLFAGFNLNSSKEVRKCLMHSI
jgi:hypothetical protein